MVTHAVISHRLTTHWVQITVISAMENSEINYSMTLRCHFIVHEVHLIVSFHLPKNPRQSLLLD